MALETGTTDDREPLSSRFLRLLSREPAPARRYDAPEVYGVGAMANVVRALPLFERTYATIRFSILRPKLLSVMDLLLPDEGRILDIGCGFGLFAAYFAQTQPGRPHRRRRPQREAHRARPPRRGGRRHRGQRVPRRRRARRPPRRQVRRRLRPRCHAPHPGRRSDRAPRAPPRSPPPARRPRDQGHHDRARVRASSSRASSTA